jgi:hypothetical protein
MLKLNNISLKGMVRQLFKNHSKVCETCQIERRKTTFNVDYKRGEYKVVVRTKSSRNVDPTPGKTQSSHIHAVST